MLGFSIPAVQGATHPLHERAHSHLSKTLNEVDTSTTVGDNVFPRTPAPSPVPASVDMTLLTQLTEVVVAALKSPSAPDKELSRQNKVADDINPDSEFQLTKLKALVVC